MDLSLFLADSWIIFLTCSSPKAFLDKRIRSFPEFTEALGVLQDREDNPVLYGEPWIQKFCQKRGDSGILQGTRGREDPLV
jgi:hypothetical protein